MKQYQTSRKRISAELLATAVERVGSSVGPTAGVCCCRAYIENPSP